MRDPALREPNYELKTMNKWFDWSLRDEVEGLRKK